MKTIYRQAKCRQCGATLTHKATGRNKFYCSTKCRVYHARAIKRWAKTCIDALMAGKPEPIAPGHAIEIAQYTVHSDGTTHRRA